MSPLLLSLYCPLKATMICQLLTGILLMSLFAGGSPRSLEAQLIVAHRGASHDAPENTIAAFNLAWEQNADGIETDCCLTRDGHIVCIHDKTTERTAGINLDVGKSTLAELKKLDVGRWKDERFAGQTIPTLDEVMASVPDGKLIVIELKVGPEIVEPLQKLLEQARQPAPSVLIISFNEDAIAEAKKRLPGIMAHWLSGYSSRNDPGSWEPQSATVIERIHATKADGFGSEARRDIFNQQFKDDLAAANINEFHVWTVDDPDDARFFRRMGAFCITTNRPAYIRSELSKESLTGQ
jgi:glycerophosphoryl diester phosphodiesterase